METTRVVFDYRRSTRTARKCISREPPVSSTPARIAAAERPPRIDLHLDALHGSRHTISTHRPVQQRHSTKTLKRSMQPLFSSCRAAHFCRCGPSSSDGSTKHSETGLFDRRDQSFVLVCLGCLLLLLCKPYRGIVHDMLDSRLRIHCLRPGGGALLYVRRSRSQRVRIT